MKYPHKIFFALLIFIFLSSLKLYSRDPTFLKFQNSNWTDSILSGLSIDEKIAQLIMITVYPDQGELHKNQIIELIKKYKPGGILIMQGNPVYSAQFINDLQAVSSIPLLVAIDGETGLGYRLDSTINYPYLQTLGAIQNDTLLYQMGFEIGQQFREMGIHINFAPVADINTNPNNPVINSRSFGEEKENVASKSWMLASGMQDAGIIAVAKHFPGHGDTDTDSHQVLPQLNHPANRIKNTEIFPFEYLINKGISGIMTAHLHVSSMDSSNIPSSLSKNVIGYLKDTLGFNGYIVTDAMNMQGVNQPNGKAELDALKAGNDMIQFVPDIEKSIESIKEGIASGEITLDNIENKCRKILAMKQWLNLNNYHPVKIENLSTRLNLPDYELTLRKLTEQSLTILKNKNLIPLTRLDTFNIASISFGRENTSSFDYMLDKYMEIDHYYISKNPSDQVLNHIKEQLSQYNLVIASIHGINLYPSNNKFGIEGLINPFKKILADKKYICVFLGNAYALKYFEGIENSDALILTYQNNRYSQELSAQLIFGAINAEGKLPVSINNHFKAGDGIIIKKNNRLKYTIPEEVGIKSSLLKHKIDSIALLGIDSAAYPGCQVLIAKDGKVIFHSCYGFLTFEQKEPVTKDKIYDFASVTKITGPLPAIMKLIDYKILNLDNPISYYWPDFKRSNKKDITLREILAHQGRLQAWIPYWQSTLAKDEKLLSRYFRNNPSSRFSVRISSNLYMNKNIQKRMFEEIKESPLRKNNEYLYSGLMFYIFPEMISNLTGINYEIYLKQKFYQPLGASTITYNPYKYFPPERIVPTEIDTLFRDEEIRGFVHDEGAAMMGGVSGNAGLFGSVNDLAKIMQMYLQKGFYGGERYISEETVNEFIKRQYPENDNRRGLGFDKPYIDNYKNILVEAYPAIDASDNSFGHSGFTGTFTWADPDNNLLFIILSNRINPSRDNQKIYDLNIRPAMHQAIYDCLK